MNQMLASSSAAAILSLDDCQGDVFRLYIAEKKPLKKVMRTIENTYGIMAT